MNTRIRHLALLASLFSPLAINAQAQVVYTTDFSTLDGWHRHDGCGGGYTWWSDATPAVRWNCGEAPYRSAPASINFNNGDNYGGGYHDSAPRHCGSITSPPIDLSVAGASATLSFWASLDLIAPGCATDSLSLSIEPVGGGVPFYDECITPSFNGCTWSEFTLALDPQWGAVEFTFEFDTGWNDVQFSSGPYIDDFLIYAGTCFPPINYCSTNANSSGNPASMDYSGSPSISANDFEIRVNDAPPGNPGLFFYGPTRASTPYADGTLCVGTGGLGYFRVHPVVVANASGSAAVSIDNTSGIYGSGLGQLSVGSTWNFQFWFRDANWGPAGFSFSDGLEVTFCP